MTIDSLKEFAVHAMETAIAELRKTGEVMQQFFLLRVGGGVDMISVAGDVTNSDKAKAELGRRIKALVAAGGIEAVVMVSDTFLGTASTENLRLMHRLRLNVEEGHELGLCTKYDAVLVSLESPGFCRHISQAYHHSGKDGLTIDLDGEPRISDSAQALPGRLGQFFAPRTDGAKQ